MFSLKSYCNIERMFSWHHSELITQKHARLLETSTAFVQQVAIISLLYVMPFDDSWPDLPARLYFQLGSTFSSAGLDSTGPPGRRCRVRHRGPILRKESSVAPCADTRPLIPVSAFSASCPTSPSTSFVCCVCLMLLEQKETDTIEECECCSRLLWAAPSQTQQGRPIVYRWN